jgi:hypothetical protein
MKTLLTYLSISVLLSSFAQNVPNGGFDIWETEDSYAIDSWVSYGKPGRTADAKSGMYALTLENFANSDGDYIPSSIYNVDWQGGGVDKFPYDGDPLSMVFEASYSLYTGDSAEFVSGFYEKGVWIGDASIKITGSSDGEYLKYAVPIRWYTTSRTPDSVYIGMKSTTTELAEGPGHITIDDFRFENIGQRTVEIENYNFENWTSKGVTYPTGWMSLDLVAFREWGGFLRNPSVVQNTTAYRGASCLAIQNFQNWDDIGEGFCFTGDTIADGYRPAFPLDQKYKFLQGYYRLENGANDSAEIAFNVFLLGDYLGEGKLRLGGTQDEWAYFSTPVTYYADFTPDSATIRIASSVNTTDNQLNTTLYLDDLRFVNEQKNTVTVNTPQLGENTVYPNPFNNILSISSTGGPYTITDLTGKIIASGILTPGTEIINTSLLSKGLYFINTTNTNQQCQQKIIKQ